MASVIWQKLLLLYTPADRPIVSNINALDDDERVNVEWNEGREIGEERWKRLQPMERKYSRSISGVILAAADADRATLAPALLAFIIRQMEPTENPQTHSAAVANSNFLVFSEQNACAGTNGRIWERCIQHHFKTTGPRNYGEVEVSSCQTTRGKRKGGRKAQIWQRKQRRDVSDS